MPRLPLHFLACVFVSSLFAQTVQEKGNTAGADDGEGGQLDLIILADKSKVNPALWLRKR
ncbi:MAG TPA: hypothetical protein VFR58_11570 [Flavisolibacter sp.]|nr:hypothetical protein [Flavisolibacter sp.]